MLSSNCKIAFYKKKIKIIEYLIVKSTNGCITTLTNCYIELTFRYIICRYKM